MPRKKTTEEFIADARAVHGDRYDYSSVCYEGNKVRVTIKCGIHGDFQQKPNGHLSGQGCGRCGGTAKLTTDLFIAQAKSVHGDRYGYSNVKYVNRKVKVLITCKKHGDFLQSPSDHIHKSAGCMQCRDEGIRARKAVESEACRKKFKSQATEVHNGKYDYSLAEYKHSKAKVRILCPSHGEFLQTPNRHLKGEGCPECGNEVKRQTALEAKSLAASRFECNARKVHGDRYGYSNVDYKGNKVKVSIYCRECDRSFNVSPNCHLRGNGCPHCASSKMNRWGKELAEDMDLIHSTEYFDSSCRDEIALRFDLAIHDHYGVKALCEFQGRQHYEPVTFGGCSQEEAEVNFANQQRRDQIKRDWCAEQDIPLIEIHYSFKDKGEQAFKDELRRQLRLHGIA
jgi:hypothetical protein